MSPNKAKFKNETHLLKRLPELVQHFLLFIISQTASFLHFVAVMLRNDFRDGMVNILYSISKEIRH